MKTVRAGVLDVAYLDHGPSNGSPDGPVAVLLHGFPYAPDAYAQVAPRLAQRGLRVVTPFLRGYGPTRFACAATPRSGEQAALGADLLALLEALGIERAILAGYDWGGRAACVVAALWPERAAGLVSGGAACNLQNIPASGRPPSPAMAQAFWYQWYFHTPQGVEALRTRPEALCRHIWQVWSPSWTFDEATFDRSAEAFANPDFAAVVAHSYRHRHAAAPGDPAYAAIEARLAALPTIAVSTVNLHGDDDAVDPPEAEAEGRRRFTGPFQRRRLPGIGHNIPQEAPEAFAQAVLDLA
ncbi:MAG: alpha/beta hydrolase [Pseudomonadota bacterium]